MEGSDCPVCGSSSISVTETKKSVTHKCNACGHSETQRKHHVGRFYAVALLVMVVACVAATIWAGGSA